MKKLLAAACLLLFAAPADGQLNRIRHGYPEFVIVTQKTPKLCMLVLHTEERITAKPIARSLRKFSKFEVGECYKTYYNASGDLVNFDKLREGCPGAEGLLELDGKLCPEDMAPEAVPATAEAMPVPMPATRATPIPADHSCGCSEPGHQIEMANLQEGAGGSDEGRDDCDQWEALADASLGTLERVCALVGKARDDMLVNHGSGPNVKYHDDLHTAHETCQKEIR